METSNSENSSSSEDPNSNSSPGGFLFLPLRYFHSPISSLLEYSGLFQVRPDASQAEPLSTSAEADSVHSGNAVYSTSSNGNGEVAIRIFGSSSVDAVGVAEDGDDMEAFVGGGEERGTGDATVVVDGDGGLENESSSRENTSSYQRYDIQQVARWIEQILPFSLLLLVVFIRQHLQGFFVTILITAFLCKSNDIVRKQTALKGERKIAILISYFVVFVLHVFGVYWWYHKDHLYYPLLLVPPKAIPPFWHAIFIILVNDTMVRQAAMALKLVLLLYYRNGKGLNFRRQGQMLTLVEYTLLLYRALLPAPVWYRFFLNKDYGSLFSSLTTGLYLTFKLTSIVEKVKSVFAALKALSRKEVHYGTYATSEQVNAAGDLCAICQEKMHAPILLRCKHIFCEDCVSEWLVLQLSSRACLNSFDFVVRAEMSNTVNFSIFSVTSALHMFHSIHFPLSFLFFCLSYSYVFKGVHGQGKHHSKIWYLVPSLSRIPSAT